MWNIDSYLPSTRSNHCQKSMIFAQSPNRCGQFAEAHTEHNTIFNLLLYENLHIIPIPIDSQDSEHYYTTEIRGPTDKFSETMKGLFTRRPLQSVKRCFFLLDIHHFHTSLIQLSNLEPQVLYFYILVSSTLNLEG